MSTWFPESSSEDGPPERPDRSRYPGARGDDAYPPAAETYEPPTRRSAQASGPGYDSRSGRNGHAPDHETQFLPPAGPPGADEGGYPAGGYPPSYPEEFAAGPRYDDLSPSGGRPVRGGPVPPPGPGAGPPSAGPPSGGPAAGQPVGGFGGPQYADLPPGGPQYADLPPGGPQYSMPSRPEPDRPGQGRSEASSGRFRGGDLHGRAPGQSLSRILAALAWPVMAIGLFVPEAGISAFHRIPAWSAFALGCLVLVGVGAFGGAQGPGAGRTWTLGVVGAVGLVAFWVLLVLPSIARNTSFMLTLGTVLAGAGVWLTPGRGRG